ncbi:putative RNA recognition motif domain, nucleotide-binding alpha-beta plait domain superfamily [Helianthus debilis subsp. tardiflorus]
MKMLNLLFVQVKTVKVSNLSLGASDRDVREFFSFSGDIVYVETQSHDERSQIAFVTFTDSQGAETAVLLSVIILCSVLLWLECKICACLCVRACVVCVDEQVCVCVKKSWIPVYHKGKMDISWHICVTVGATIVDTVVSVTLDPEYQLPPAATAAPKHFGSNVPDRNGSTLRKAEDVVTSMFAKGFVLGKDAIGKAKTFDEKHRLTSTASSKVSSFDKKIGFTEKVSAGTSVVTDKVKVVDQKLHVSEKAKSAFTAAENTVSSAGSAMMKNRYVFTSASWVTGAFSKVKKAAGEVGQQTKEKVEKAEEEKRRKTVDDYAQVHLSEPPTAPDSTQQPHSSKPAPVTGLVL